MEATKTNAAIGESQPTSRKDVYSIVNERIIEKLEQGTVPWQQPWTVAGVPMNGISKRAYRGINVMLLAMLGYEHNIFMTFKQIKEIGGSVKRGEHGNMVVFWNYVERNEAQKERTDGTPLEEMAKKVPMLRYYSVYNVAQCEGIPEKYLAKAAHNWEPIQKCDEIVSGMPKQPRIVHSKQSAFYDPLKDYVNMPKYNSFVRPEAFYSTLFHELVHSTGHNSRLERKGLLEMAEFGSEPYSQEELVAEIGTCYLQSYAGIITEFEQSAAYIEHWLKVLRGDHRFIFTAFTLAQKATDFILNIKDEVEDSEQKSV